MGLKLGQNINFWLFFFGFSAFLVATRLSGRNKAFWSRHWSRQLAWSRHWSRHTTCRDTGRDTGHDTGRYSLLGRDTGRDILPVATYFLSRHTFLVATYFLIATCFSSPTCRGHNFFILTRNWVCEYSLERYLNVECIHEGI